LAFAVVDVVRSPSVINLGLIASKFVDMSNMNAGSLHKFFTCANQKNREELQANSSTCSSVVDKIVNEKLESPTDLCQGEESVQGGFNCVLTSEPECVNNVSCKFSKSTSQNHVRSDDSLSRECQTDKPNASTENTVDKVTREKSVVNDVVPCDKCGADISPWDLPEHLDWHVAVDLQKQEHSVSSQSVNESSADNYHCSSSKKRKHCSNTKPLSVVKRSRSLMTGVKKISSFFSYGDRL